MKPLACVAAVLVLAACGDDQHLATPQGWESVDLATAYDDPADFDRSDCERGRLSGLDPAGSTWRLTYAYGEHYADWGSLRVDGDEVTLDSSEFSSTMTLSVDDLFVRAVAPDGDVLAVTFCSSDGHGGLVGRYADCSPLGCREDRVTAARLARIPGEPDAHGLELVGELPVSAQPLNVRVRDGLAYVATDFGLEIIDVSDPEAPRARGTLEAYSGYNDVKVFELTDGRFFVLASGYSPTAVIDVADPDAPVALATFEGAHTIFVETRLGHTRAYLGSGDLLIYDLDVPAAPRRIGTYYLPEADVFGGNVHDLYVEEGRAYLGYWDRGLTIVDTWAHPDDATLVGRFMDYPHRSSHSVWVTTIDGCKVAAHGDEGAYAHLRLIGVDEACPDTFLRQLGEIETRPEVSIHNVMAFGTRVYASYYMDGVRIYDVADPTAPREIAHFNTFAWTDGWTPYFEGAIGIDVDLDANLIYVADTVRGLLILRETP